MVVVVDAAFWPSTVGRRPATRKAAIARAVRRRVLLSGSPAGALSRSSFSSLRNVSSMLSMLAASIPWTAPLDATHHGSVFAPRGCLGSWSWPDVFAVVVLAGRSIRLLVAACVWVRGGRRNGCMAGRVCCVLLLWW